MHSVSPYPNTALAVWQLVLIAVVALGGVAFWLGAVYMAAREPRDRDRALSRDPAQDTATAVPAPERGQHAAA
jgi:hypothetical protein